MKKLIYSFFLLVFFQISSDAQKAYSLQMDETLLADNNDSVSNHQPKLFYFGFGNSLTSHNAGISANIIYSNNWKGSFSYRYYEREAKNKPSNYIPQHTFFGPIEAVDETHALSVMVGRIFPNISDICRVGFEAGPSFLYYKERHFKPESWSDKGTVGLSLKTNLEIAVLPVLGAEMAFNANINKYHPYIVIELSILIGKVRHKNAN